ncbi:peptidylprolyl isomerase [Nocardia transvalensis]|nr:peptidylprolyl isomerase [Nocardia transvalensis]
MTAAEAQPNGKQWPAEPAMSIDPSATYSADLQTNCGTITVALDAAHAPRTVNSFVFLSGEQYFNHTRCHRLTTEGIFVLQCGDPTGTGSGTPGYQIADENLTGATYPAGTVAMANSGPDTNGSQFFLVYSDSKLPPAYTPFGRIASGMDVLQNIAAGGTKDNSGDGSPTSDIILQTVTTHN